MSELEGIAIVGIAARFPGARDAEELWRNLRDGIETVSFFSEEELAAAGVDPALLADPRYVRAKGSLADADLFDAAFFGFTPREAEAMDPQHRVFLECAWEALEDAGYDPERPGGRVGLYAGSGISSYLLHNLLPDPDLPDTLGALQAVLLNDRDFFATRASYKLNLRGPSVSVQTACSTSLVAVHMASQSLLGGECDLALAGGVSISSPLRTGYLYQEGSVMSPDGHCRAFDARAGGSVEGNGCGVVALKRLADALADGDPIHAVIRGSAVNNDGSGKVGFTAPSVEGQAEVISEALMMAGVEPATIGYVEAHGSGTPLGDPIEVAALSQAFAGAAPGSCALGSVKTSIGHCNTAAGVAGLIKATLALVHETLPPSLHFESPNPEIAFDGSPFQVCAEARPWETNGAPRRAGVSSFGLGGTNAHAVLEQAPEPEPGDPPSRPAQLLVLSARTPTAREAAAERLAGHLDAHPELSLADVAWTLQVGRKAFEHRQIRVGGDWIVGRRQEKPAVVFLFPGLGDQHVDMARELYETEPFFREQVDLCAGKLDFNLLDVLFSPGEWRPSEKKAPDLRSMLRRSPETTPLHETVYAQPACFVIEYALGRLLMDWGIEPQAMIGYSLGEYVAACLSGALSLDDALELVTRRAKLIQDLPGGAMLAVPLPEEEVRPLLVDGLSLSATNGPHFCVVGGPAEAVEALDLKLGVSSLRLRTKHAFHSSMMEPAVAPFAEIARKVRMQTPRIPFLSNVTGTWITADDFADPADPGYWARHMRSPVRFAEGIGELLQDPDRVFLEVGPGATLGTLVKQHPSANANRVTIPTLREGSDLEAVLEAVGRLWIAGVEIDWPRFHNGERRRRVPLPTYPFERQRFWIDPPKAALKTSSDLADWFWVPSWKQVPLKAAAPEPGRWLIFLDGLGLGERIADRLRHDGHEVFTVARGQDYDLRESQPDRILHVWGLTAEEPAFEEAQDAGLVSLTLLTQALAAVDKPIRLLVVANGLHELVDGDPIHPGKATILGALKVMHQELPRLTCGSVDVTLAPGLEDRLLAEFSTPVETAVALRGRQRWVRSFERLRLPEEDSLLAEGAVYLIADAAHGPGMAIADHLVRRLDARVALVLPPEFPPRERWETWKALPEVPPGQDVIGAAILRLLTLEREVGLDRVLLSRDLRSAFAETRARFGPVHGAFYTGGTFAGGLLQLKKPETLHAVLDPVARGAEALLESVDAEPEPPAFVLLSSTSTAVTGGLGQLDVAAAGGYLEALAVRREAEGKAHTLSVQWDPYHWGAWLVLGVASGMSGVATEEVQANLMAHGVTEEKSADALRRLLASPLPRVVVSGQDLHALIAETDSVTADTLLAQIAPVRRGAKAQRPGLARPYEPPRDELEEKLAAIWQDLFGIESIGRDDDFLELGGHSLLAIQVTTQVHSLLQADLPVTALFESPNIAELAKAVRRARGEEDPEELEALLAIIEGLSPEEAAARLAELEV
ncbi:MAG TPA: beta-ketoacyl synthase N-terminal-like domain-containing protein [Thermoanaerobaculia bacterium]|nr:beta-ketoacyl synthase N-terminal-like domain-containing protein [Thermoanaerobaculia bacterium]